MALPARRSAYHPHPVAPTRTIEHARPRVGPFRLIKGGSRRPAPKIEEVIHKRGNKTIIFQKINGKVRRVIIKQPGKNIQLFGPKQYDALQKRVDAYRKKHPHASSAQIAVGLAASHVEVFKGLAKEGAHSFLASLIDLM